MSKLDPRLSTDYLHFVEQVCEMIIEEALIDFDRRPYLVKYLDQILDLHVSAKLQESSDFRVIQCAIAVLKDNARKPQLT